jgi:uncharacterized protein (DUF1800 family)
MEDRRVNPKLLSVASFLGAWLVVCACAPILARPDTAQTREDVEWLNRVTYGINTSTLAEYRRVGRLAFLREQLAPRDTSLPPQIAQQIDALPVSHEELPAVMSMVDAWKTRNKAITDPAQLEQGRHALRERGEQFTQQAIERSLLRAVYSPAQLREQLVWFWLNHFSVYAHTHDTKWMVGDYEENAIRPNALGHFRDLVMATLEHPAMLQYLDNEQNAGDQLNENYARELMELHTLGVDAGYSQHDVQELARVLTGVGNNIGPAPELKPEWQPLYRRQGVFEFNPARHDFGSKSLLGQSIVGSGFGEVEQAVTLLVRQPACAQFISRRLATYFVADDPPPKLIERMARTFQKTDGDIAAVLGVMLTSREFTASLRGQKFKDPMHYVVSAVRLAYDGRPIANPEPLVRWLEVLGEPLYGRPTPDGYPLTQDGWASSGQMVRRLDVAQLISADDAGLFPSKGNGAANGSGFPRLVSRVYFDAVEPYLSARTADTLERSSSQREWNALLLASPEFNYR